MKRILTLALLICLPLALLACKADEASRQSLPHKPTSAVTLRVGYIPVADCSQLFVAIEKGFFASRHINIKLVSMPGGAKILEALGAGSLEIGFSNVVSLIQAHDAGLPFVALTGGPMEDSEHKEHAILVMSDQKISSLRDLQQKTVALNNRRNIDELMVTLLLKKNGIPLQGVRFVEIPFPRMIAALEKNDVQAAASIEPYVTIGLTTGKIRALSYNYVDLQPVTEISTYVGSREWIKNNREVTRLFAEAIRDATEFANKNPNEVRHILARYTNLEPEYLDKVTLPGFTAELSERGLQDFILHSHQLGWIQREFPAGELLSK